MPSGPGGPATLHFQEGRAKPQTLSLDFRGEEWLLRAGRGPAVRAHPERTLPSLPGQGLGTLQCRPDSRQQLPEWDQKRPSTQRSPASWAELRFWVGPALTLSCLPFPRGEGRSTITVSASAPAHPWDRHMHMGAPVGWNCPVSDSGIQMLFSRPGAPAVFSCLLVDLPHDCPISKTTRDNRP